MIVDPQNPYVDADPFAADPRFDRHAALTYAASGIRARRGAKVPVEQILLAAAAVLFPLGLVFIILGWEGAAHNGHTYAQISYLISGGIFGLGLSIAGGFMYFGYWLSRHLSEARRQSAATVTALRRVEALLDASLNSQMAGRGAISAANGPRGAIRARVPDRSAPVRPAGRPKAMPADAPTGEVPAVGPSTALVATPRGSLLHKPDCPVVAKRRDLRPVRPGTDGYGYCTMCDSANAVRP